MSATLPAVEWGEGGGCGCGRSASAAGGEAAGALAPLAVEPSDRLAVAAAAAEGDVARLAPLPLVDAERCMAQWRGEQNGK